jgi:AAA+ ATPase superfamily predicted ATPase
MTWVPPEPYYRVVITGRTQTGKTSFIRCALLGELNAYIIYDPDMQFNGYGQVVENVKAFVAAIKGGARQIVFQPRDILMGYPDARIEEFEMLCKIIDRLRNVTFIVDEVSHITRPENRRAAFVPPTFRMLIVRRMKSPYRIGIIITTQRMKDADVDFISQAQHTYTFAQNATDAKYIAEKLGMPIKELIESLPPHEYLRYDHITREINRGNFTWTPPPSRVTSPPK